MVTRLAREVAEASRAATGRKPRTSHTDTLVDIARSLERLQAKRRKLRRELRTIDADIKHVKRELRAMVAHVSGADKEPL